MQKKTLILFLIFFPLPFSFNHSPYYVLWDVGQGQWLSRIDSFYCLHLDMGGEFYPNKVDKECQSQINYVWISHKDWDHYSFLKKFSYRHYLIENSKILQPIYNPKKYQSKNDSSKIFLLDQKILVPGDSSKRQERLWQSLLRDKKVQVLILGHHGSKTSTSKELINRLNSTIKYALCSNRKAKYGHPHTVVLKKLKENDIPLSCTNDWGNIRFL